MQNISDALLEKLNKLKNLADGAAAIGSMEEAAVAAEKYQILLLKHNLSEAEVNEHSQQKKIEMLVGNFDSDEYSDYIKDVLWVQKLGKAVTYSCMCQFLKMDRGGKYLIIGDKTNVSVALYIIDQLVIKITNAMLVSHMKYKGSETKKQFYHGFLVGCVEVVSKKLYESERMAVAEDNKLAIVVRDKRQESRDYMLNNYRVTMSRGRSLGTNSNDGYGNGRQAGSGINIHKGVNGNGGGSYGGKMLN